MVKSSKKKHDMKMIVIILLLMIVIGLAIGWSVHLTEMEKKSKNDKKKIVAQLMNNM